MKDVETTNSPNYSNLKQYLEQAKEISIKFRNLSSISVDSDKTKTCTEDESSSLKKSSNFDLSFAKQTEEEENDENKSEKLQEITFDSSQAFF
jgi:hypothetical protein